MAGQKKLVGTVKDFNSKRGFGAAPATVCLAVRPTFHPALHPALLPAALGVLKGRRETANDDPMKSEQKAG